MSAPAPEPANPLQTADMPWIPSEPGNSFRPLRFATDGWSELMRVEPGYAVGLHRHSRPVHAFNLAGKRRILGSGEVVGPGDYVYEPGGMIDGWEAVGDEPCVIHLNIVGAVEYLDGAGRVIAVADSGLAARRIPDVVPRAQRRARTPDHRRRRGLRRGATPRSLARQTRGCLR
jgi:2,4'-dihydroxyacetophenone dioxygenase